MMANVHIKIARNSYEKGTCSDSLGIEIEQPLKLLDDHLTLLRTSGGDASSR